MSEELDKPLLDPQSFIPDDIDLVTSPSLSLPYCAFNFNLRY